MKALRHKAQRQTKKEVFTVLGEVKEVDGRKRFIPISADYLKDQLARLPAGKKISATFSEYRALRSNPQLRYHWVIVGYIADHTGYTKPEVHDALLKLKFGTKAVTIAGQTTQVRRSMADSGDLEKYEVVELIEYDLEVCKKLEIYVPTPEELGYLPS